MKRGLNDSKLVYDVVFSGFGASSCLLIHKFHKCQELLGKKILIIDPLQKNTNDKTFCFWAEPSESIIEDLNHLITHSWEKVTFDGVSANSILPLRYHHVTCEKLYESTRKILENYDVKFLNDTVIDLYETDRAIVKTLGGEYFGEKIFDSRIPKQSGTENQKQNIWQSFLGFKVILNEGVFDPNMCTLMDFNVDQGNFTQFVYVLPFSTNEGLIEFTRFGKEVIEEDYAHDQLQQYITKKYGKYTIDTIERGKIPMSMDIPSSKPTKSIVPIGSRANKVKPSTGYAFKNMYNHTQEITLKKGNSSRTTSPNSRFRFYDGLLIYILSVWPHLGKPIFERLFAIKSTRYILKFLEEKTRLHEDISMFSKLQLGIFLKALFFYTLDKFKPVAPVVIISIFYYLLSAIVPNQANNIMYGTIFSGMLVIGIPHGALDFKIGVLTKSKSISFPFLLKYLAIMSVVYLLWIVSPTISLISFIIYSSWHFGQTDAEEWKIQSSIVGFIWGILFFTALLSSHTTELNAILQALEIQVLPQVMTWKILFLVSVATSFYLALRFKNFSLFVLSFFLGLSYFIPVVIAFSIYFVFHHSWKGWSHLRHSLGETNVSLFKSALPFNFGALILFAIFFLNEGETFTYNLAMIFIFISCISFPHILCMHLFYKKNQETKPHNLEN